MSVFVTDTHALIWYTLNKHSKLSRAALAAFEKTKTSETLVQIPAVVLYEIAVLERDNKIKLNDGFSRWSEKLLDDNGFILAALEPQIIARAVSYNFNNDPFDKIIVATAAQLSFPLITKDEAITNSNLIDICW